MGSSAGEEFEIETRWKEIVIYREGAAEHRFDAGWGVRPLVLYVPTAEAWDEVVPPWLQGRREIVLERLRNHSNHVLEEGPY